MSLVSNPIDPFRFARGFKFVFTRDFISIDIFGSRMGEIDICPITNLKIFSKFDTNTDKDM